MKLKDHLANIIPPDIEADAIQRFEQNTFATTGYVWVWEKARIEVRNRWRIIAFIAKIERLEQRS